MIPIADQLAEVEREVRDRERRYPDRVARGRLKPETAERKLAEMRAVAATIRFISRHAAGLRELVTALRLIDADTDPAAVAEMSDEMRQALLAVPAVAAVLEEWPEAELVGIRPTAPPEADRIAAGEAASEEETEDA